MLKNFTTSFVTSMKKELLHGGYKKTFDKVQSLVTEYEWEWLSSVAEFVSRDSKKRGRKFVSLCPSCQLRNPQLSTPPLKPIIANGFFCRLQVSRIVLTLCCNPFVKSDGLYVW